MPDSTHASDDPIARFIRWQQLATERFGVGESGWPRVRRALIAPARWIMRPLFGEIPHADAASLATATAAGVPSVRQVLVKGASADGFPFYTNYTSRKAVELRDNPVAELVFHWPFPPRQVRISGRVERLTAAQNQAYWQSRPRGSQLSAMASYQSAVVPNRRVLQQRVAELAERWRDQTIPCPEYWGGYRLIPQAIEFWQGREDRLHDRWLYQRVAAEGPAAHWQVERLAP